MIFDEKQTGDTSTYLLRGEQRSGEQSRGEQTESRVRNERDEKKKKDSRVQPIAEPQHNTAKHSHKIATAKHSHSIATATATPQPTATAHSHSTATAQPTATTATCTLHTYLHSHSAMRMCMVPKCARRMITGYCILIHFAAATFNGVQHIISAFGRRDVNPMQVQSSTIGMLRSIHTHIIGCGVVSVWC